MNWHERSANEVVGVLSRPEGLTTAEALQRLVEHGPNVLTASERHGPLAMFLAQFRDFMILVLLAAAIISGTRRRSEGHDGHRRDRTPQRGAGLRAGVPGRAGGGGAPGPRGPDGDCAARRPAARRSRRASVVPGDMVLLEAGRRRPGGSAPHRGRHAQGRRSGAHRGIGPRREDDARRSRPRAPVGERRNLAYKGTVVTYGRGPGVASRPGMATEFGKIAAMLETPGEGRDPAAAAARALRAPPGHRRAGRSARSSSSPASRAARTALLMFMTAVSLAVAAIPEALPGRGRPITLALGARKMAPEARADRGSCRPSRRSAR